MKKFWNKIKPVVVIVWWSTLTVGLLISTVAAVNFQSEQRVKTFAVNIDHSNGVYFLTDENVKQILIDNNYQTLVQQALQNVDLHRLEIILEHNPFVKSAQVFTDDDGNISINIIQRKPIVHVINNLGVSFYIDEQGVKMPTSNNFTARVIVASGFIGDTGELNNNLDSATTHSIYKLAAYINTDSILQTLIQQVYINEQKEFVLVPLIGNHYILFGDINNMNEKFEKLKMFYSEGWNKAAYADYSLINLKYNNEIFATRRNAKVVLPAEDTLNNTIDSTQTITH